MDIDTVLTNFSYYMNELSHNDSVVSAVVTLMFCACGLAIHAFLQRRGKTREMTRKQQEALNRKVADYIGDALLTMLARNILSPKEYKEKHDLIAYALGIADMMPRESQKALKNKIKARRKHRQDHPEKPVHIPGPMPIQDISPMKKELVKPENVMLRFQKKAA